MRHNREYEIVGTVKINLDEFHWSRYPPGPIRYLNSVSELMVGVLVCVVI